MKIEQFTLICYIRSSYKYITLQDTKNNYEETDINILIDTVNLLDKEKYFIRLKLEGMTMEEITEDLGENAYKIRHSIRQKIEIYL